MFIISEITLNQDLLSDCLLVTIDTQKQIQDKALYNWKHLNSLNKVTYSLEQSSSEPAEQESKTINHKEHTKKLH